MKEIYAADFETNTDPEQCRVWAWGLHHIYKSDNNFIYGNSIDSFFEHLKKIKKNSTIYFHNEKFDGKFILYYLHTHGYKRSDNKEANTFDETIDDTLKFYDITIRHEVGGKIVVLHIRDSLKKVNMPVAAMPKAFGLDINKGDLDNDPEQGYDVVRPIGHELTDFEIEYLKNDVIILSKVLKALYDQGLTQMTAAMDSMSKFKEMIGKKTFERYFPPLDYDEDLFDRHGYFGGWVYCLKPQTVGEGRVYDNNSEHPSSLYSEINGVKHPLPVYQGVYFTGKYEEDAGYPLYFQRFACSFRCKKDHLPFIQVRKGFSFNSKPKYEIESNGIMELTLTNVDLKLFFETYDITSEITWIDGYKYVGVAGIFDNYIDYWLSEKAKAKEEGNTAYYAICKIYINSLYGKFGTNKLVTSKESYYDEENDIVRYRKVQYKHADGRVTDSFIKKAYYLPVAAFCTAYSRRTIMDVANKAYQDGRFCYSDTDSVHITGDYPLEGIPVDPYKLGFWDHESSFKKAKFIRAKTYAEYVCNKKKNEYEWEVKCAGMPQATKDAISKMENFEEIYDVGFCTHKVDHKGRYLEDEKGNYIRVYEDVPGRLKPKDVPGGTILKEEPFAIKPDIDS